MTTPVLTITLNPTIDVFGEADAVRPTHKVRLTKSTYEPGGGGINVARVIATLGGDVEALSLAGGEMGAFLPAAARGGHCAPAHRHCRADPRGADGA